ncbi:glycosyltransferase family 4 protein [Planctomycetota bacterium]
MRVLHAATYYPPDRIGGVGEVVRHLHCGLLASGHQSTVLTSGHSGQDPAVLRIASSPQRFVIEVAKQAGMASDVDVVHCHHGETMLLLLAMRARGIGTPVLATFHVAYRGMAQAFAPYVLEGIRFGSGWRGWHYRLLRATLHRAADRLLRRWADGTSFISRSSASDVVGPEAACSANVIYNAVTGPHESEAAPLPEAVELLFVGTLSHRKRVHALPFVLSYVRRRLPGARLRIVGFDLTENRELQRLFSDLGLDNGVLCEGPVRSERIPSFYRSARVLIVPSAYEGLPMVILEAFRCGLPCVATRVSGHPEVVVDGENGFLVTPDEPEELAERCVRILEDTALRERMGEHARRLVEERFGVDRQVREYVALYRRICGVAHVPAATAG